MVRGGESVVQERGSKPNSYCDVVARVVLVVVAGLTIVAGAAAPAGAQADLIDSCAGYDHPPFERDYPGDGASYGLVGASVNGPMDLLVWFGEQQQTLSFDGPGRMVAPFPIFEFGDYPWSLSDRSGTELQSGVVSVGPQEVACNDQTLVAPPSPSPSVTPQSPAATPPTPEATSTPIVTETGSSVLVWIVLIVLGLLLLAGGTVLLAFNIDWSGAQRCPHECPVLGAKTSCDVSSFGISSQGRTPASDAGIDLALTLMRHAPLPGMGTGGFTIGLSVVTGSAPPAPLAPTASGAARGPTIDLTKEFHSFLNTRFPQIWIRISYDECRTSRCFPQVWRTYRSLVRVTSPWIQVREGTPTVADPMGVFPPVADWAKPGIAQAINQAIVDTVASFGCS
jgi:hypothetical protein